VSPLIEERIERIDRALSILADESKAGATVIVEGPRDRRSLRSLGICGEILCVKAGGERLIDRLEQLKGGSRAIVLTDFDEEGARLARYLEAELSHRGVRITTRIWKELRGLSKSEAVGVEDLATFFERMNSSSWPLAEASGHHYPNHIR